jgi:glycosyltransferase involved in cell wall biosynthesis
VATKRGRPKLSVIICIYDMPREAPRTILSAGVPYQKDVDAGDYEVIVVDNGSNRRLPDAARARLPAGVSLVDAPDPRPSPARAMNWAARERARGDILMFAIDGARIFSDRLYAATLSAHDLVAGAFVYTLAWHLGPKVQKVSVGEGYDQTVEDRLLVESGWPGRPAALYDISVFASSSGRGFFRPISESNAFSVPRDVFERLGGYDECYVSPGGGLCNLEIFARYVTRPGARNVCLLSEGTFHQVHGGVATSGIRSWDDFQAEHREIFGRKYKRPVYETLYFGSMRPEASRFLRQSLDAL